ncbi:hypothetical protein B0H16DRAFT_790625 [Mycena metata]|uniref:Uncharacterized protein n=1 Tax=Mycena metata TaxID=1033252 RepID=A0AAD7DSP7_9AGAR|nr:hypothetical protein B0H16DRAFT_790625 [Mycena metata]
MRGCAAVLCRHMCVTLQVIEGPTRLNDVFSGEELRRYSRRHARACALAADARCREPHAVCQACELTSRAVVAVERVVAGLVRLTAFDLKICSTTARTTSSRTAIGLRGRARPRYLSSSCHTYKAPRLARGDAAGPGKLHQRVIRNFRRSKFGHLLVRKPLSESQTHHSARSLKTLRPYCIWPLVGLSYRFIYPLKLVPWIKTKTPIGRNRGAAIFMPRKIRRVHQSLKSTPRSALEDAHKARTGVEGCKLAKKVTY